MSNINSNLALLIDADNVSHRVISGLMTEVAKYGTASVRRIYGDWTSTIAAGWKSCLLQHSILPIQQFAYTKGKNATDGAMIIDAMDLLYTGRFSSFCIVSSDSDFTRLAARIREQGVTVYGFGNRSTHPAFVNACNEFIYFDALNTEPEEAATTTPVAFLGSPRPVSQSITTQQLPTKPFSSADLQKLATAVKNVPSYDGEWVNLADVGSYLRKIAPDLNASNYGYDRLRNFFMASGIVESQMKPMGNHPPIALVRLKPLTSWTSQIKSGW